jgi:hypothetical protein
MIHQTNLIQSENGKIDRDEVITAIQDYFSTSITRDDVIAMIQQYFADRV